MLEPSFLCLKLIVFIYYYNIKCLIFCWWICLNSLVISLFAVNPSKIYSLIKWWVIFPFFFIFMGIIFLLLFYQRLLLWNNACISVLYLKICVVLLMLLVIMMLNWKCIQWKSVFVFRLINLDLSCFLLFYFILIRSLTLTKWYSSIVLFIDLILVLLWFIFKVFFIWTFILDDLKSRVKVHVRIEIFCHFRNRVILNLLTGIFIKGLPSWWNIGNIVRNKSNFWNIFAHVQADIILLNYYNF